MKPLVLHFLDWRISVGLSALSLLFNLVYFYLIDHNMVEALKLSASSLLSIGAMHCAHSMSIKSST